MKDKKEKLSKEEKALKKSEAKKDKKANKFIEIIKKKWLIKGTTTVALVAALIVIFVGINLIMQKLNLTPLDFSKDKLYTLTSESKEKVKNIDKDVNIYFVGYTDSDSNLDLAKQYNKANNKIKAEAVDANSRQDLVQKYGIESGSQGIIIACGDKSKVLSSSDLVTYDTSSYQTISVAEEKLTNAIVSVTSEKIPKVYFLEGYSDFSLSKNMQYLKMLLQNEINDIDSLNVLTKGKYYNGNYIDIYIKKNNKNFNYIGIAVSVKVGKAVKRNRIKRLIRENYRLLEDKISVGYDIIFLWKKNKNISEANFFNIKYDIIKTLNKSNLLKKDED